MSRNKGNKDRQQIEDLEKAWRESSDEVLVNVLLDMSGSMGAVWDETIDLFNEFVNGLTVDGVPAAVSLVMFDTEYLPQYFNRPVGEVPPLTRKTYVPRGATALLDAMGRTIAETAALKYRPRKVLIVVLTDGQENSSREYDRKSLVKLVQSKQAEGWEFLYLSASLTAFADAQAVGMAEGRMLRFSQDEKSMRSARVAMMRSMESYRKTGRSDMREMGYSADVQDVPEEDEG